ncbi:MAG TPA: prepilin-type N-terminal cleavage/methylation domain-containing protein [Acidimicrobiales bacterium]|nr:prepilin-type N-terminal cleavage/methylation domain-containing protein [Acidimicrobiales bacterium]
MIQILRKRMDRKDEGFTLIELMVVVLIIAILLAIAIPTFLGARSRAQNRSAQSNLRNALTAEKTAYTDAQTYVSNSTSLTSIEPSLSWVTTAPAKGTTQVEVVTDTGNDTVCLGAVSASGSTYWVLDDGAGTFYTNASATNYAAPTAANCIPANAVTTAGWYPTTTAGGW